MKPCGYLAEFPDPATLRRALGELRAAGYARIAIYTPWPVDGVRAPGQSHMAPVMLAAFLLGMLGGLLMQYVAATQSYPINVGGRPLASWPAFVPAALELGMLFAAITGLIAFFARTGLPRLYRPEFNVAWFDEASRAGCLLMIGADDPIWDEHRCARDLAALDPLRYALVPA